MRIENLLLGLVCLFSAVVGAYGWTHHPDPLSLIPFRKQGHYTAEGYALLAQTIRQRLTEDRVLDTNGPLPTFGELGQ